MNRGGPPSVHLWFTAVRYTVCQATPKETAKAAPPNRGGTMTTATRTHTLSPAPHAADSASPGRNSHEHS